MSTITKCWIEKRGQQYRVYYRKPEGGKGYLPLTTRAEADHVAEAVRAHGVGAVTNALQNPVTQPAASAVRAAHGPDAANRQLAGDLPVRPGNPTDITFDELAANYLAGLTGLEDKTLEDYQGQLEGHLLPYFGGQDIGLILGKQPPGSDVDWVTVTGWVGWMRKRKKLTRKGKPNGPYADKTIRNVHGLLYAIFAHAVDDETSPVLVRNPCESTKLPKTESIERTFLEPRQFVALLAYIPDYWKPLVMFLVGTGLRWAEAAGLQVKHVHLDPQDGRPFIEVYTALGWRKDPETGRRTRTLGRLKSPAARRRVYLSAQLVAVIRPLIECYDHLEPAERGRQLVFVTAEGAKLHHSNFNDRVFKPAVARAFADGTAPELTRIHSLRHSCAAWMASAGAGLRVIKKHLGHDSINTTDKYYGHLCEGADEGALLAIDLGLAGEVATVTNLLAHGERAIALITAPDVEDMELPEVDDDDEDLAA